MDSNQDNQMGQRHLLPNPFIQDPVAASNSAQSAPPVASQAGQQFQSAQQRQIELSSGDGRPASALSSSSDDNVPGSPQISHHPEHQAILHFAGITGSHQIPAAPNPQQAASTSPGFASTSPGFDPMQYNQITPADAMAQQQNIPQTPQQDKINIGSSFPSPQKVVTVSSVVPPQDTSAASSSFSGTSSAPAAVPAQAAVVVPQPAPVQQQYAVGPAVVVPQPAPVQPPQQPAVYVGPVPGQQQQLQPAPLYQQPQQQPPPQQYQQPDLIPSGAMVPYGQRGPPPPQDQQVAMYRPQPQQPPYYQQQQNQYQQPQYYQDQGYYQGGYGPMAQYQGGYGPMAQFVGGFGGYGGGFQVRPQAPPPQSFFPNVPDVSKSGVPMAQKISTEQTYNPDGTVQSKYDYDCKPAAGVIQSGQAMGASFNSQIVGQVPQQGTSQMYTAPQLMTAAHSLSAATSQMQQPTSVQPLPTQVQPQPTTAANPIVVDGIPFSTPQEAAKYKFEMDFMKAQAAAAAVAASSTSTPQSSQQPSTSAPRFRQTSLASPASAAGGDLFSGVGFQDDDSFSNFGDGDSVGRGGGGNRWKGENTILAIVKPEPIDFDDRRSSFGRVTESAARAYAAEFSAHDSDDKTMATIRFAGSLYDDPKAYSDDEWMEKSPEKGSEQIPQGMKKIPVTHSMAPRHKRLQSLYERYIGVLPDELGKYQRLIHQAVVKQLEQMSRMDLPRCDYPILTEAEARTGQFNLLLNNPTTFDLNPLHLPKNVTKPPGFDNLVDYEKLSKAPLKETGQIREVGAFVFRFKGRLALCNLKSYAFAGGLGMTDAESPNFYTLSEADVKGSMVRNDVTKDYLPFFEGGKLTKLRQLTYAMSNGPFPEKLKAEAELIRQQFFPDKSTRPPVIPAEGSMGDEIRKRHPNLASFERAYWPYVTEHPETVYVEFPEMDSLINRDQSVCYMNQANERGLLSLAFGGIEDVCNAKTRISVGFGSTTAWQVEPGKFVRHERTLSGKTVYRTLKPADVPRALKIFRDEYFKTAYGKCSRADQHEVFVVDPQLLIDRGFEVGIVMAFPGDLISFEEGTMWCATAVGLMENVVVYWSALTVRHFALKLGVPASYLCECGWPSNSRRLHIEENLIRLDVAWYLACRDPRLAFTDDPESSCPPCNFYPDRQDTKEQRKEAMANHVKGDPTRACCMSDAIGYHTAEQRLTMKRAATIRAEKMEKAAQKAAEKAAEKAQKAAAKKPVTPKTVAVSKRTTSERSDGEGGSTVSGQLTTTGTSGRSSPVMDHPESEQSDTEEGPEDKPAKEDQKKKAAKESKAKDPIPAELVDLAKDSSDSDADEPDKKPSAAAAKQASAKTPAVDAATSSKSTAPNSGDKRRAAAQKETEKQAQKTAAAAAAVMSGPPPPRPAAIAAAASFKATPPAPLYPLKRGEFPKGGKSAAIKTDPVSESTPKTKKGPQRVKGGGAKGRVADIIDAKIVDPRAARMIYEQGDLFVMAQRANLKVSMSKKRKVGGDSDEDSQADEDMEADDDDDTQEDIDSDGGGHDLRHRKRDDSDDEGKGGGAAGVSGSTAKRARKQRSELERLSNY